MDKTHKIVLRIQYVFVCLFFGSLNFEMFSPFMEDLSISKMTAFLYIIGTFMSPLNSVLNVTRIRGVLVAVFLMFGFMVISSILNGCYKIFDFSLFLNIIMFWLLLNHYRRDPRIFNDGLLWFALSASLVGLLFIFGIGVSFDEQSGRFSIFDDNENGVGIKMALGILFIVNYTLNYTRNAPLHKPWLLVLTIPMIVLLFATASRTAVIVLALGIILFVIFRPTSSRWLRFLWLVIGAIVIYYGIVLISEQELLMARFVLTAEEGSLSQRDSIWLMYWKLIQENIFLGVGFTGGEGIAKRVFGEVRSPHNVFVEVALYSGILGFIPFLCFVYFLYRNAFMYLRHEKNLCPIMMSIGLAGMLLGGQALNVKLFWTMAAFAISYQVSHNMSRKISVKPVNAV